MKKKDLSRATAIVLSAIMTAGTLAGCGSLAETAVNVGQSMAESAAGEETTSTSETGAERDGQENSETEYPVDDYATGVTESVVSEAMTESAACADKASEEAYDNSSAMKQQGAAARKYAEAAEYDVIYHNSEEYSTVEESGFKSVAKDPLSTFSADVDTAAYSNLRRMIYDGYSLYDIPTDAVRIEEMINYFDYDYQKPLGDVPFSVTTEIGDCPWNEEAKLMLVGMQTEAVDFTDTAPSNLVFLLDVSGSMYSEDKLPLLQKAFSMLTTNLTSKDRVSIVTYAGSDEVLLEGVRGSEYELITDTLESLEAGGSTAGSKGIITAYEIAEDYFIKGGNNRVILATDGDLNVGLTSEEELEELISEEKETGVYLSVLGFGTGNLKDNKMEVLADKGNGNYAYIDSATEAKKVLVEEMGATLVTVAKDVKFQVEFNPEMISDYRLVGYDNRVMAAEDFADDSKDAGEVGAGHSVTALYELITTDAADTYSKKGSIDLKYQERDYVYDDNDSDRQSGSDDEWLTVSVRYKEPEGAKSRLIEHPVTGEAYQKHNSDNWLFASAVAEFGMILKDSEYQEEASLRQVLKMLDQADCTGDDYKKEFSELVEIVWERLNLSF